MTSFLELFFSSSSFMPHIHCYLGKPSLVWMMAVTDSLIGLAYIVISVTLYALVRKVKLPFRMAFLAFGAFILACGMTHFMEVYNLWVPDYWLAAFVKGITAAASVITAIYLLKIFPKILDLTETVKQLAQTQSSAEKTFFKRLSTPPELKRHLMQAVYLPAGFAVLLICISIHQARYLGAVQSQIDHSNEILRVAQSLKSSATDAQSDFRGYWFSGIEEFAVSSRKNEAAFDETFASLEKLASNNPSQTHRLKDIKLLFEEWRQFTRESLRSATTVDERRKTRLSFNARNSALSKRTTAASELFLQSERDLRSSRSEKTRLISFLIIASVGLLTLVFGAIFSIFGRGALFQVSSTYGRALESERLQAGRVRSVVDHVVDGIITINEKFQIESWNPAAKKIFGHQEAEVMGKNVNVLMPEPYQSEHDSYVSNYLHTSRAKIIGIGREVIGRRKDGSTFPMDLAVSEFKLGGKRFFTGIVRDITDRKRAEEELHAAIHARDEFLSIASHELKTPLTSLSLQLQIIERSYKPEVGQGQSLQKLADSLRVSLRQVKSLTRLVDELLDASRIQMGRFTLNLEDMDISALTEDILGRFSAELSKARCSVHLQLEKNLVGNWDSNRIEQVIVNFISNAIKYAPGNPIHISTRKEGELGVLIIKDFGPGIAEEKQSKIFERFERAGPSEKVSGMGLGLFIAKRIVAAHGGSIRVKSETGKGTEFTVEIPLHPVLPADSTESGAPGANQAT